MKTKLLIATVSCLLLFASTAQAQPDLSLIMIPPPGVDFIQTQKSFMVQSGLKANWKNDIRWYWNGQGADLMAFAAIRDPDLRVAWNLSEEQYRQLKDYEDNIDEARQNDPVYRKLKEEIEAINNPDDPYMHSADEETKNMWLDIEDRGRAWMTSYYSDGIRSILTAEQMQKIQETHLADMGDYPIVSPYLFEALGLTNAQKQQMEEIQKELEPEFEKHLEDSINDQLFLVNKMYDELEKLGVKDIDSMMKEMGAVGKILNADPEYKKVLGEVQSKGKQFATRFKMRMLDVLTNEQWTRLQRLIDDPPEHVKVIRNKFKKNKGESEKAKAWQPGADSWKPGDPIPEEYRQKRNQRTFPHTEN